MRMHPQLPIIQEHGCLALARIAFDEVQQLKVTPSQRIGGYRRNETAHTVAAHPLPLLVHCPTERLRWSVGTYRLG